MLLRVNVSYYWLMQKQEALFPVSRRKIDAVMVKVTEPDLHTDNCVTTNSRTFVQSLCFPRCRIVELDK